MQKTFLLIVFLLIVFFLADHFGPLPFLHAKKYIMLVFFSAISYLLHVVIGQVMGDKRDKFIEFYLATVIIKFLASIIFVAVNLYLGVENRMMFIVNFFVLYLFFTLFEIFGLSRKLQRF